MISTFKTEVQRIADAIPTECQFLAIDELQKFVNGYTFSTVLINLRPIMKGGFRSDAGGATIYDGTILIDFLLLANVNDTEDTKDGYIDTCIDTATTLHRELRRNSERKFVNPIFDLGWEVTRFKTSNYCVGITATVNYITGCNR